MKKQITPLFVALLLLGGCMGNTGPDYDNSADIAYLEQNAQRDEVTVTDSGLQFEVLEEGDGEQPGPTSEVRVHYEGWLINNLIFDSSRNRGEPTDFALDGNLIPGFVEGVQLMQVGGTYQLVLPAELGYGDRAQFDQFGRQIIHPGATLIFEVELLEILEETEENE